MVAHLALGDAPPRTRTSGRLPLEGVRVLDLTRVIAGPVCTRFLGALGADVLRIDPPRHPDMGKGVVADTLLAKRSAGLDLADDGHLSVLHALLDGADLLVCGYRPGSLDRFGLDPGALAERHPGLVAVYLAAWGHTGPWAGRRGFDSVVQAPTGIAMGESDVGRAPGALPCQLLDHGTGYLAAAAAMDGLRRQSEEGGTRVRRLSLARTALWLAGAGRQGDGTIPDPPADDTASMAEFGEGADRIRAVNPPGSLHGAPLTWPGPPARYLADRPAWLATPR